MNLVLQIVLHYLYVGLPITYGISLFKQKSCAQPIRKVAVIGAGISGLSLAHAIENSATCAKPLLELKNSHLDPEYQSTNSFGIEAHIFDSRASLDFNAGAGVQLNGGLRALMEINPILHRDVANAGIPLKKIKSRAKPWFGSESFSSLLELELEKEIKLAGGLAEKNLIIDGEVMATTIMRGALQEVLLDTLPPETSKRVKFGKQLCKIRGSEAGITCEFTDGTADGPFDLIVGCDGINSAVKEYIDMGDISNKVEKATKIYSGIRIKYGVQDGHSPDDTIDSNELCQYFGDGAYGLVGNYGAGVGRMPTKGAFLIFRDEDWNGPFKKKEVNSRQNVEENADWTQDVRISVGSTMYNIIKESGVPEFQIGPIVNEGDRFFELGVYFHNPFNIRGWSRKVRESEDKHVCLAGDAAHAMPPFLGQGSNQAIQDSVCLATKIFEYNAHVIVQGEKSNEKVKSLQIFLKEYENIRWLPTTSITLKAILLGYLETGDAGFLSKFRDVFFYTCGRLGIARKVFLDAATPKYK